MTMFSELLRSATRDGAALTLDVPPDWAQGRTIFGGLQAAFAVQAMRAQVPDAPLRTLQVTFVAPVTGTLRTEAVVLRKGSSATHVEARIMGKDGLAGIAIGVFGTPRASAVVVERAQPVVTRERAIELPYIPGLAPAFIQHFRGTWLRGAMLLSGGTETEHVIEVELKDDGPPTEALAIALADFIPPLALTMLRKPTPGGTLTWMLEFLVDRFERGVHRVDAELMAAKDGYTSQSIVLWGPDGRAIALGRQSMVVFG